MARKTKSESDEVRGEGSVLIQAEDDPTKTVALRRGLYNPRVHTLAEEPKSAPPEPARSWLGDEKAAQDDEGAL